MRNFAFFLSISIGFASCSEDFFSQTLDIEQPEYDKQLVLHGFGGSLDSNFRISLSQNYGILENVPDSGWAVAGALVELYEDGQKTATLTPFFGQSQDSRELYGVPVQPGFFQAGKTYELRASHPDFPAVVGRQIMPQPVQVDSVRFRENGGIDSDGSKLSAVDVFLKDTPGQEDFYEIRISTRYPVVRSTTYPDGTVIYDTIRYDVYTQYPESADDPNAQLTFGGGIAVSDKFFDGEAYKFGVRIYETNFPMFHVSVRAVTEDYYLWSISAQRKSDTEDFPFAEPVTTYSNLENGIGVFALFHEQVFEIK